MIRSCALLLALVLGISLHAAAAGRARLIADGDIDLRDGAGRQFVEHALKPAGIAVDMVSSVGATDTLEKLVNGNGLQLAIVPSDMMIAYQSATARGYPLAALRAQPLRALAPMQTQYVFFIVRADSGMFFLHDMEHARMSLGVESSSSAMTATVIYQKLFGRSLPREQAYFQPTDLALVKLLTEHTIDVVAFVGNAQSRLIADMKPEARRFVRVLRIDPARTDLSRLAPAYSSATLSAANFSNLLDADVDTLSLQLLLVTYERGSRDELQLSAIAQAWCKVPANVLPAPLLPDENGAAGNLAHWAVSSAFIGEYQACRSNTSTTPIACVTDDLTLGLCGK